MSVDRELARQHLCNLARRYARPGPRYTSYPTALDFGPLSAGDYVQQLEQARRRANDPWSAYIHVPFCAKRCDFCACSVIASPQHERVAAPYVDDLIREIELVSAQIGSRRRLAQLHLGGGTPTYLAPAQLERAIQAIAREFLRDPEGEWSMELDARATTAAHIELIGEYGFDRVSLGVQDLDPDVQAKIGRIQSAAKITEVVRGCRRAGVGGVNFDLVYGLPGQTLDSLRRTISGVLELLPDRLAIYGYAHMPWAPGRGNQRRIDAAALPDPQQRLELLLATRELLLDAGYQAIGMDHFALPEDPLARADRAGTLMRNFMGYTVRAGADLLGFGVTAIGEVGGAYVQNHSKLVHWRQAIQRGELPTARGLVRSREDELRGTIIAALMCEHRVDKRAIEARFSRGQWRFDERFAADLAELRGPLADGLITDDPAALTLTETGKLFVRNVAMAFDQRLRDRRALATPAPTPARVPIAAARKAASPRFSATV
ncbi:oxygen-independent coproporphyrinogen III oxidase [Pseudenhygromyxa sp. WMMC2535]|uniref:oxygen-independent coproporphyrinogen III oxidase n=1 Tax=Pseudenhygromyxa sp. WMMC2535 TaxID=2712867 RepID=UPI001556E2BE|nr:oxygen-independent coproporphyrinogen III oxidase [Pseudenhygromyxa sp. WMMC2535]NVB43098.1 oxygen-independent coproporphyrinogen III oxidase [Pseudenhygromyxa sp. WMMC2535]